MKFNRKTATIAGTVVAAGALLAGCSTDNDVVSENISKAADQFEIPRRIVFVNGITDKYVLEVNGMCSISDDGNQLEVVCKTGPDEYVKHFLGKSDNLTYFAEQTNGTAVDSSQYRVIFRPEALIPNVDRP